MRILLSTCFVFLLSAISVVGQSSPRTSSGKVQQSAPVTSGAKPRITTTPPKSMERSSSTSSSPSRTVDRSANSGVSSTERSVGSSARTGSSTPSLSPSPTTLRNSLVPPRPSATDYNQRAAAKGNNMKPAKKIMPLKPVERGTVNWMTLEQALEKSKTEKRKIFIDVYTDWCGWCKHMDSTTFIHPSVAKYLNEHYYPVKFNAEQTQDILFKEKTYHIKKMGNRGYHELAALWLNNRFSFPTVVFLDENQNLIQPVPGYLDATKMEAIINYFGTDSHRKTPWETYEKNFTGQQK